MIGASEKKEIDGVIVCGNSNEYGSELQGRFETLSECIAEARSMTEPHPNCWPAILHRMGLDTINSSTPGSGFMSNVARAIELHRKRPNALYIIDISLMEHVPDAEVSFRSRNCLLFSKSRIERQILSCSIDDMIFMFNEIRKMLHQLGMNFKLISFMNPFLDLEPLKSFDGREEYLQFLRDRAFTNYPVMEESILEDFLFKNPYFLEVDPKSVSPFSHVTDIEELKKIATKIYDIVTTTYLVKSS